MNKRLLLFLSGEAILIIALAFLFRKYPNLFSMVLAFPFWEIAYAANGLSSLGRIGTGLALMLCACAGVIPLFFALHGKIKRDTLPERITLFILSLIIPLGIYSIVSNGFDMIPGDINGNEGFLFDDAAVFGAIIVWSVIFVFVGFRFLRLLRSDSKETLMKRLRVLLQVVAVLFMGMASFSFAGVLEFLIPERYDVISVTLLFFFAKLLNVIPSLMTVITILSILSFLKLSEEEESETILKRKNRVKKNCAATIIAAFVCPALSNLIQFGLRNSFLDIRYQIDFPVAEMLCIVLFLLFIRLTEENRKLSDDNKLFI